MLTVCIRALLLAGVALGGLAAWAAVGSNRDEPVRDLPMVVEFPDMNLGELSVGRHEFQVRVTNPNSRPRRILGMASGCRANMCFLSRHNGPVTVNPGETFVCTWGLEAKTAGPVSIPLTIYLEENGIRVVEQTAHGVVVGEGRSDGSPNP